MASGQISGGVGNDTLGSDKGNDTLGGSKGGGSGGGPKGTGGNTSGPKSTKPGVPSLPQIPDGSGGAALPEPVDLSLLAGPQELPQRQPLRNNSVAVPQTGVTGYAGVFIP